MRLSILLAENNKASQSGVIPKETALIENVLKQQEKVGLGEPEERYQMPLITKWDM